MEHMKAADVPDEMAAEQADREELMDKVSLAYFVDFVLRCGTPKLTGVREYKERRDELSTDFYRPIREAIVEMHRKGAPLSMLDEVIAAHTEEKRARIYPLVVAGYRKFLNGDEKRWFEPPHTSVWLGDLEINVNPELGLLIHKKPHLVKLYFRSEPLTAKRASVILSLLAKGLSEGYPSHVLAVLDVPRAKLFTFTAPNPRLDVLLRGEAAAFSAIYGAL
jgi:hypothetical protein